MSFWLSTLSLSLFICIIQYLFFGIFVFSLLDIRAFSAAQIFHIVRITYSNSQFNDSISRSSRSSIRGFDSFYSIHTLTQWHCVLNTETVTRTISRWYVIMWASDETTLIRNTTHTSSDIYSISPNISREFWRWKSNKIPFDHENVCNSCVCMCLDPCSIHTNRLAELALKSHSFFILEWQAIKAALLNDTNRLLYSSVFLSHSVSTVFSASCFSHKLTHK